MHIAPNDTDTTCCGIFFQQKHYHTFQRGKHVSQTAMKTSWCLKKEKNGMPRQENLLVLDDAE